MPRGKKRSAGQGFGRPGAHSKRFKYNCAASAGRLLIALTELRKQIGQEVKIPIYMKEPNRHWPKVLFTRICSIIGTTPDEMNRIGMRNVINYFRRNDPAFRDTYDQLIEPTEIMLDMRARRQQGKQAAIQPNLDANIINHDESIEHQPVQNDLVAENTDEDSNANIIDGDDQPAQNDINPDSEEHDEEPNISANERGSARTSSTPKCGSKRKRECRN